MCKALWKLRRYKVKKCSWKSLNPLNLFIFNLVTNIDASNGFLLRLQLPSLFTTGIRSELQIVSVKVGVSIQNVNDIDIKSASDQD